MTRILVAAGWLLLMVTLIVSVDIAFLRDHFWERLGVNVGIVAVFALAYVFLIQRWTAQ
ncbi:hypothetical protein G7085_08080 [Tessaracoccus sp. HDW20]|uniref:hypothetical protein n=1 Tax=Tessaracoccus coleopterorum TaxID=2714950 RepID=UPI0018D46145|nr:hypothetical protein [Tessaracoccus coleopterorum]NHB84583.1 hypothetical protein [Tessaracoccus coleopterorum]